MAGAQTFFIWFVALLASGIHATGANSPGEGRLLQLRDATSNYMAQASFDGAAWGISVRSVRSGESILEVNASKLMKPASVAKLFTAALALNELGPQGRIRTSVYGELGRNGRAVGPLILYGRGDPSLNSRLLTNSSATLESLAQQLYKRGLRSAPKGIAVDGSFFSGARYGTGWTWDDTHYGYGAPVTALNIGENVIVVRASPGERVGDRGVLEIMDRRHPFAIENKSTTAEEGSSLDWRVTERGMIKKRPPSWMGARRTQHDKVVHFFGTIGSEDSFTVAVPLPDPLEWAGAVFRQELEEAGIKTGSVTVSPGSHRSRTELAFVESPTIAELLHPMLTGSQNLYAQSLLLHIGARSESAAGTTEERGIDELREFVVKAGVRRADILLEEGSGLSRSALITPQAVVQLLGHIATNEIGRVIEAALARPGAPGTLSKRLLPAATELRAKTGSFRYVTTLAGYVRGAHDDLAFAIFLNNYETSAGAPSGGEAVDAIALRLAEFVGGAQSARNSRDKD